MSEWFADDVNSRGEFFTFIWNDSEEKAKLLNKKSGERVRFRWMADEEEGDSYYFEIRILKKMLIIMMLLIGTVSYSQEKTKEAVIVTSENKITFNQSFCYCGSQISSSNDGNFLQLHSVLVFST